MKKITRSKVPGWYRYLDNATTIVLFTAIIYCPWAFGSTVKWAISTMNYLCYTVGVLRLALVVGCRLTGFAPLTWKHTSHSPAGTARMRSWNIAFWSAVFAILAWIIISAANSRATFDQIDYSFNYIEALGWLPHSYHKHGTWRLFFNYSAFVIVFWAIGSWVSVVPADYDSAAPKPAPQRFASIPPRLKALLLLMVVNAALLVFEGVLQRASGTHKVLWLLPCMTWSFNQFGPWPYRGNAAQYFNLLWPVGVALILVLKSEHKLLGPYSGKGGSGAYLVLIPFVMLLTASPLIAGSRAGVVLMALGLGILIWQFASISALPVRIISLWTCAMLLLASVLVLAAGQGNLSRFSTLLHPSLDGSAVERTRQYLNTFRMIKDYPLFGVGPGAYQAVYFLYIGEGDIVFPYAHSEFLQFISEFGILGCVFLIAAVGFYTLAVRSRHTEFPLIRKALIIGLLLTVLYSLVDFPFQIYSTTFQFVVVAAVLFALPARDCA